MSLSNKAVQHSRRDALLISAAQLQQTMEDARLQVIDASCYLPTEQRDAFAEYRLEHIPGAVFFDIDRIADTTSGLPHTLASPGAFGDAMSALGISDTDRIVVYDAVGVYSAPRIAWNLRVMGAHDVRVLDGGLPAWKAEGGALAASTTSERPEGNGRRATGLARGSARGSFAASLQAGAVANRLDVQTHLEAGTAVVMDVRAAARFAGSVEEPRAGVRSGHMPGAVNLPFQDLLRDGHLLSDAEILARMNALGIGPDTAVVTSCGSGVTAAVACLALECIGYACPVLYDGSWAEWGAHPETQVVRD